MKPTESIGKNTSGLCCVLGKLAAEA